MPAPPPCPDHRLLARASRGDDEALRALLRRHGHKARSVVRGKVPPKHRAVLDEDDIMQVTYIEAFLHTAQFKGTTTSAFVSWLQRIARHALLDALRGLDSRKRPDPGRRITAQASYAAFLDHLESSSTTPSRQVARQEARGTVEALLEHLPADYAIVVRQCDLHGRSIRDVARDLDRSPGAIHMLRARAYARLRELLGSASHYLSDTA